MLLFDLRQVVAGQMLFVKSLRASNYMAIASFGNQILLRPNSSLSPKAGVAVVAGLTMVVMLIALSFLHMGAWLVMPFAGLEILAIAGAFYIMYMHSNDFERITIQDDRVIVEKRNYKKITTNEFQRYWMQVNLRPVLGNTAVPGKSGLFISSHGKEVELGGNFINDEQRALLARELKQKLKNIY